MVRAGQGGYLIDEFIEKQVVAIGWNETGKLDESLSSEDLKRKFREAYPEDTDGRVNQCVGQISRFLKEFKIGDKVVTYDSSARVYYLGEIVSKYEYNTELEYHHSRRVEWEDLGIQRDDLSISSKNTLGAISTIFELDLDLWNELEYHHPAYVSDSELEELHEMQEKLEEEQLEHFKENIISSSQEFIKDIISRLSWQDLELLTAGLLRAMGYKTRMTSKGGDLGRDIIASPDELGLEEPRVKVEVKKKSKDKISSEEIRSFIGGMRGYHKGIFVTSTGFSKEAEYEAERANNAITLVDSNWLVELIVSYYELLDPEIKSLIPLKKIYWPV